MPSGGNKVRRLKQVFIDNLECGMIVARDVYAPQGGYRPLICKNTALTSFMLEKLAFHGIRSVYILEEPAPPPEPKLELNARKIYVPDEIYVPKAKPIIEEKLQKEALEDLETIFNTISINKQDVHASSLQVIRHLDTVVGQLVDSLQSNRGALININDLKSYDEYTYHHSLSVAVLSIAIGQRLGLCQDELHRLGICAMMHDIGKTGIPIEIIHKTSRLNDSEISLMKTHSPVGYDYLVNSEIGDEDIWRGVLHHHEKVDGTGYPYGIKANHIPLWSRIISVADVYDALTSNRPYRQPMQPAEAIEYIMGGADSAFDFDMVTAFVRKVELYPVGSLVELSNHKIAVVLNNENQMRPVVRLTDTSDIFDLSRDRKYLNIVVLRILTEDMVTITTQL